MRLASACSLKILAEYRALPLLDRTELPTLRLSKVLSEQPIAPEGLVVSRALAQLLRGEAGVPAHLPDHMRLVGKSRRRGKPGPVDIAVVDRLVPSGIELLGVAKAVQVALAGAGP